MREVFSLKTRADSSISLLLDSPVGGRQKWIFNATISTYRYFQ